MADCSVKVVAIVHLVIACPVPVTCVTSSKLCLLYGPKMVHVAGHWRIFPLALIYREFVSTSLKKVPFFVIYRVNSDFIEKFLPSLQQEGNLISH